MSDTQGDWTKPAAMAIPKGGTASPGETSHEVFKQKALSRTWRSQD